MSRSRTLTPAPPGTLPSHPVTRKIVTDQLRSYAAAKADIPELGHVKRVFAKAAARLNNTAENSHRPTRTRERQLYGFRDLTPVVIDA